VGVRVGLTMLLTASALLSLVAAAVWLVGVFPEREAVGQTSRDSTITAPPPVFGAQDAQPLSLPVPRRRAGGRLR